MNQFKSTLNLDANVKWDGPEMDTFVPLTEILMDGLITIWTVTIHAVKQIIAWKFQTPDKKMQMTMEWEMHVIQMLMMMEF